MNNIKLKENFKPILFAVVMAILLVLMVVSAKVFNNPKGKINISPTQIPMIQTSEAPNVEPNAEADDLIETFNNSEKVPYQYTLSGGEEVTIEIPKGIDPPPQAVVEKLKAFEKKEKTGN